MLINRPPSRLICLIVLLAGGCTTSGAATVPGNGDGLAQDGAVAFQCGDLGTLTLRFPDPETIELDAGGRSVVLPQTRSASGARYVKDGIEFWTKGDEALYILNGVEHACVAR